MIYPDGSVAARWTRPEDVGQAELGRRLAARRAAGDKRGRDEVVRTILEGDRDLRAQVESETGEKLPPKERTS